LQTKLVLATHAGTTLDDQVAHFPEYCGQMHVRIPLAGFVNKLSYKKLCSLMYDLLHN